MLTHHRFGTRLCLCGADGAAVSADHPDVGSGAIQRRLAAEQDMHASTRLRQSATCVVRAGKVIGYHQHWRFP